jgi:hypothetical protein
MTSSATALRPRSVTEIVDAAFSLMRARYGAYIAITMVIEIPILLLKAAVYADVNPTPRAIAWGPAAIEFLAVTLMSSIAQGVCAAAMSADYLGEGFHLSRAVRRVRDRLGTLFAAVLLQWAAVFAGLVLLIIPGLYASMRLGIVLGVAVVDERVTGGVSAVRRTWDLGRNQMGRLFLTLLFVTLIFVIFLVALQWLMIGLGSSWPGLRSPRTQELVVSASGCLYYPFLVAVQVVLYYDLRVRNEAFDVEMMSAALGAPAPA